MDWLDSFWNLVGFVSDEISFTSFSSCLRLAGWDSLGGLDRADTNFVNLVGTSKNRSFRSNVLDRATFGSVEFCFRSVAAEGGTGDLISLSGED